MTTETTCPYQYETECAMARERDAAGVSNDIPDCPVHGPYPADA